MARIAYLCSTFPSISTTFIQREVRAIFDKGFDLILVSNRAPQKGEYHPNDENLFRNTYYLRSVRPLRYFSANIKWFIKSPGRYFNSIRLVYFLKDNFSSFQRLKNLLHLFGAAVLAEHLVQNHVHHIHIHFAFGAASVAIFLNELTGLPYSLSIHGSDVLLNRPLTEEKLKRAKFIISNCQYHISNLTRRFPDIVNKKFYLVRLGIDFKNELWNASGPTRAHRRLHLLNIGRLVAVKRQDLLIRACAILRDRGIKFFCKIVGDGPERNKLKNLISELDLEEYVILLGKIFENEVSKLYDWADIFVLSSESEGTPMTIIEAMAKEKPVVAPRITAIPELVVHGETGYLFKSGSESDLADTIHHLSREPLRWRDMGNNGRCRAEALFNIDSNVERIISIFSAETADILE